MSRSHFNVVFFNVVFCLAYAVFAIAIFGNVVAQERKDKRQVSPLPEPSRTVIYKRVGEKSLELHLFQTPQADQARPSKSPAIVFFFGGGWTSGSPSQFYPHAKHLAELGILAACADYRVRSRDGAAVADCIADAQDAVAYLRDHATELNIDPQRIVAAGGSAGGHLAAACATVSYRGTEKRLPGDYRPNALVLFNPALILGAASSSELKLTDKEQAKIDALAERLGDQAEKLSPYHQLTKSLPPTLILHGKADTTVPYKTVELFTAKAKELGCDCVLVGYDGQQHGFFNYQRSQDNYQATRDEMLKFLRRLGYVH